MQGSFILGHIQLKILHLKTTLQTHAEAWNIRYIDRVPYFH